MADWRALAGELEALHEALMTAAPDAPDEIEEQIVELHAISIRHIAHHLHHLADEEETDG
jgi:hypothetical protein